MDKTHSVSRVSIEIKEDNVEEGATELLQEIRQHWKISDIKFSLLTDGITNKLVKCYLKDNSEDVVLVRIYGHKTDLLIDRKAETRNIILLHNANLAPRLYATFNNGLAYEYVPGDTLKYETVIQPNIYNLVAEKMGQLHLVIPNNNTRNEPMLWDKMLQFYNLIPEVFTDVQKHKRFEKMPFSKPRLLAEINNLRNKLIKLNSPVVFAHNDLLLGNVIYNSNSNSVTFIDYEYAAMNYQAFDIGNHFAEFVGVGVEDIDYSRYPNKDLQWNWLKTYLQTYHSTKNINEEEIHKFYVQANQFALASHLLWGLWSFVQAEHSNIDFDYMEFASVRLTEYFNRKEEFLSLQ